MSHLCILVRYLMISLFKHGKRHAAINGRFCWFQWCMAFICTISGSQSCNPILKSHQIWALSQMPPFPGCCQTPVCHMARAHAKNVISAPRGATERFLMHTKPALFNKIWIKYENETILLVHIFANGKLLQYPANAPSWYLYCQTGMNKRHSSGINFQLQMMCGRNRLQIHVSLF